MRTLRVWLVAVSLLLGMQSAGTAAAAAPTVIGGSKANTGSICEIALTARAFTDHPDKLAFQLWAAGTSGGVVSGTIVVYANGQRFDVPFTHAQVAPARVPGKAGTDPAPVVVQFPAAVDLESTYLGSLQNQDIPQCIIFSPFIGPKDGGLKLLQIADHPASGAPDAAVAVTPIQAPAPQPALAVNCKNQYRDPYVGYKAPVMGPPVLLVAAQVTVTALLKSDGNVLGFEVAGAPDHSALKDRAIAATLASKFFPEIYRCEPVDGQYVFQVEFQQGNPSFSAAMGSSPMDITRGHIRDEVSASKLPQQSRSNRLGGANSCSSNPDDPNCAPDSQNDTAKTAK